MADVGDEMLDDSVPEEVAAVDVSVTMVETTEVIETQTEVVNGSGPNDTNGANNEDEDGEVEVVDLDQSPNTPRNTFINYLKSPIVEIVVGTGQSATVLRAHQALLLQSPYFAERIDTFDYDGTTQILFPDDELDAVGCFLQYLYTGEYFPKKMPDSRSLEHDPSAPDVDDTGVVLLRHARVYTLAGKLGLPELQALAHSKIHRINSTARGEIAYARYVYASTPRDDTTIRKPIAAFWAHRSHVLRHEAEDDFRKMCLDFPEFGYDVLSLVLDAKEKSKDKEHLGSSRKRARTSTAT